MKRRKPKKRSPTCTAEVVEVHGPRHGSGGELLRFHLIRRRPYMVLGEYHTRAEANAKRKDLCGMLRKTGGPFKRVIQSWTSYQLHAPQPELDYSPESRKRPYDSGLYGLGAPTQVHLDRSAELVRRAHHELEQAARAPTCDLRVSIAFEALSLATLALADTDSTTIRRPPAFDASGRYIAQAPDEPFRAADQRFTRALGIASAAKGIILGCSKGGPR